MMVLVTAKQRASADALFPVAQELMSRGHTVTIYATGNDSEIAGFQGLPYLRMQSGEISYSRLVEGHDIVLTGLSGHASPDGYFIRSANAKHIPTIAVLNRNSELSERFGSRYENLPTIIAVINTGCIDSITHDVEEIGEEAGRRCKVVGWTAFDHYATMREQFTEEKRVSLLRGLGLDPEKSLYLHLTQIIHPNTEYMKCVDRPLNQRWRDFTYEHGVTQAVFEAASDLGLQLTVKPHPGEEYKINYTRDLAMRHRFCFIPASACSSQQLMLAAYSVTAGRSSSLTEACLLDRNVAAIIPDMESSWITAIPLSAFPPLDLNAIPSAHSWEEISDVLQKITSTDKAILEELTRRRQKFAVDGNASKRVADLMEQLVS